jgi:hypothetical protein
MQRMQSMLFCFLLMCPILAAPEDTSRTAADTLQKKTVRDDSIQSGERKDTLTAGDSVLVPAVPAEQVNDSVGPSGSGMRDTLSANDSTAVADAPAKRDSARSDTAAGLEKDTAYSSDAIKLRDLIVRDKSARIHKRKEASRQRLNRLQIQKIPAVQGDPMRALSTLPGISHQSDLNVRPFIRGGKAEETRVFWDRIPLMQPYHFGSLYSLFNVESIEEVTVYSGGFPVEGNNAISGAVFFKSRPAPLDSFRLAADLSLIRANGYAGVPVLRDKLGVYASWQSFWYDFFFNRAWDLSAWLVDNEEYTQAKKDFQKYVDLPNFKDLQFGTTWKPMRDIDVNYVGLLSHDVFTSMWMRKAYYVRGNEVAPSFWERHFLFSNEPASSREVKDILDTIALVRVDNDIHNAHFKWTPAEKWTVEQSLAFQGQKWHVEFFDNEEWIDTSVSADQFLGGRDPTASDTRFKLERRLYSWNGNTGYYGIAKHSLSAGMTYDYLEEKFDTDMLRFIYEIIYNGNTDVLNALGHYNTQGLIIRRDDSNTFSDINYLNRLMRQIVFKHKGKTWGSFYGLYLQDKWEITPRQRLTGGIRLEYEENADEFFASPRAAYFFNVDSANEITLASGLYSQNDIPFYMRQANKDLVSEKAVHVNGEWTHHFSPHYRLELQNYYKFYFDMLVPRLDYTGRINWGDGMIGDIDSLDFQDLTEEQQQDFMDLYGEREFRYRNSGIGNALGAELSFFYDPLPVWNGWISAELSLSNRRDRKHEDWYAFRYHRPWIFNWVNYFRFPGGKYEASLRARYAAGLPYTEFQTEMEESSDTLLYIGPRNEKRYSPYSRVDFRLTRSSTVFGHPFHTYFGIWNFFNRPNFLLRDRKTKEIKFFDYNIPVPVIFLGMDFRW